MTQAGWIPSGCWHVARLHARVTTARVLSFVWLPSLGLPALVFWQDVPQLRLLGLPSGWDSLDVFLLALAISVPVQWTLQHRHDAARWEARVLGAPVVQSLGWMIGMAVAVLATVIVATSAAITLERIIVGAADLGRAAGGLGRAVLCALPFCALAPVLAMNTMRSSTTLLAWLLLLVTSAGVFGRGVPVPLDRLASLGQPESPSVPRQLASIGLAVLGGTLLSAKPALRGSTRTRT